MNETLEEMSIADPKISIGIVVYNGVEHIGSALKSVADQSYKNIEVIVVDGGSTDGTLDILEEYSKCISVMISEPDKGIYDAMNKVRAKASGDWLLFMGCDDVLLDVVEEAVSLFSRPENIYYGDVILRSTGKVSGGKFSRYKLMNRNFCHQAVFYPRQIYKQHSYSMKYRWLADYDYNFRLYSQGVPFVYLRKVIAVFNDQGGSSEGDADFERDRLARIRKEFGVHYWAVKIFRDKVVKVIKGCLKCLPGQASRSRGR